MAKISRLYDRLTPEERLALIVNACARGDQTERDRLVFSAPSIAVKMRDYEPLTKNLNELTWRYLVEQLRLLIEISVHASPIPGMPVDPIVNYLAYQLFTQADGWRQFCSGLGIEPEAPLAHLPAFQLLKRHEPSIRAIACSQDEASAFVGRPADTAAEIAKTLLSQLREGHPQKPQSSI